MNIKKISLLLGLWLALWVSTSAATPVAKDNDPLATVNQAYQIESDENGISPFDPPYINKLFSAALVELLKTDDCVKEQNDEVGVLDYDPFIDGQDGEVKKLNTRIVQHDQDKATVEVTFVSFDEKKNLLFDVLLEKGMWRIDDIHSRLEDGKRDSLRAALEAAYPNGDQSCLSKKSME
ncbi:MAG: DUF3828 domain-containing protein [Thiotrichaceae bacterium]